MDRFIWGMCVGGEGGHELIWWGGGGGGDVGGDMG